MDFGPIEHENIVGNGLWVREDDFLFHLANPIIFPIRPALSAFNVVDNRNIKG